MVENQELLKTGIGSEEAVTLKPTRVTIVEVEVGQFGTKKANKVVCICQHPDSDNPIKISGVKYELKGKLDTSGLWLNVDSKKLIRKGSALAVFLQSQGCQTIEQLKGKEVLTSTDEKGYLVFKAY
jgi:hypothetical protein